MTHAAINVVVQMTIPANYVYIKVATQHVYETRCFYGFDDLHYCNTRGSIQAGVVHIGTSCVFFAAVLRVFLKSSYFAQGLPQQRYYDFGVLEE